MIYGVVVCNMDIIRIRSEVFSFYLWDICKIIFLGGSNYFYITEFFGFGSRLIRPGAGYHIVRLTGFNHQIKEHGYNKASDPPRGGKFW